MSRYYSDEQKAEIKDRIIDWISDGKTLRSFCRQEGSPTYSAVYGWREEDEEFAARFARARLIGEEAISDECLEIADDATNDWMESLDSEGQPVGWKLNGEHVQRSKLRIYTREKLLAVWNPKKYGNKIEHSGNPDAPLVHRDLTAAQYSELRNKTLEDDDV